MGLEEGFKNIGFAVLEIPLTEVVPADLLSHLLGPLSKLHFAEFWLEEADRSTSPDIFPHEISLEISNSLLISKLEIGTPNIIRLIGKKSRIKAIAVTLAAVIAVPEGATTLLKGVEEVKMISAQTENILIDTKLKEIQLEELLEKAKRLREANRISEKSYKHKLEMYPEELEKLKRGSAIVSGKISIQEI